MRDWVFGVLLIPAFLGGVLLGQGSRDVERFAEPTIDEVGTERVAYFDGHWLRRSCDRYLRQYVWTWHSLLWSVGERCLVY